MAARKRRWKAARRTSRRARDFAPEVPGRPVRRFLLTAAGLVLILYGAFQVLTRTPGFRAMVEEKLGERTGLPAQVAAVRATWKMGLIIEGVRIGSSSGGTRTYCRIRRVLLDWRPWYGPGGGFLRGAVLEGLYLELRRGAGGGWGALPLARPAWRLAGLLELDMPSGEAKDPSGAADVKGAQGAEGQEARGAEARGVHLVIRDGELVWMSGGGILARVKGLDLECIPLTAGERKMEYVCVDAESVFVRPQRRLRRVAGELLLTGGHRIVLGMRGDWARRSGEVRGRLEGMEGDTLEERVRRQLGGR